MTETDRHMSDRSKFGEAKIGNTCSAWRSKFHIRKRSDCPPKLLIQVFRSEIVNHVSEGLHCEFPTVGPIHAHSLDTLAILFGPSRFDHQIKRIRNILFR